MFNILIGLSAGFSIGSGLSILTHLLLRRQKIHQTRQSAQSIVQKAKEEQAQIQEQIVNEMEEYKMSLMQKQEEYIEQVAIENQRLKEDIEQIAQQKEEKLKHLKKRKDSYFSQKEEMLKINSQKEQKLTQAKNDFKQAKSLLLQDLQNRFDINLEKLKQESGKRQMLKVKSDIAARIKEKEEYLKHNVNQQAHFILGLVLSRFQQAYCSERGIRNVNWTSQPAMKALLGPGFEKLKILEKECGVDMKVSDKEPSVSILGLDPVRRELGRACLQKIAGKKHIKENEIKKIVSEVKKSLFRRIKNDGQRLCRELALRDVKPEIKNMMGALRYRYSFAQNQYFHCQEVGKLCALLNAELYCSGLSFPDCFDILSDISLKTQKNLPARELAESYNLSRRAGLFHDIGKAMDHSKEGGHAVIGADFIEKHGERAEVVRAVRAHHHDVPPEKPLDFLVIAADALSGARPGARRSTVDSYNQKVLTLEKIGHSFKGVKDTYIMSAGREIRVIVDSQKINDVKALELSKKIAGKIEEECSYPGLIKVTVVRQVSKSINIQNLQSQAGGL